MAGGGITDGNSKVVSYGYDSAGRRTSITYPGTTGTVNYGYDDANRLTSVTDWLSQVTSYSYDDTNRLTSTTLGNGLISDRTYDDANRLLSVTNRDGGTTISSYTYTLDDVGNRSQVVDTSGTTTYGYDDLYRLTDVTYHNSDTQTYSYDEMGNRETKVENGSTTTNYTYDDADEMTAAGGVSYSYDDNGNQVAAGSDTYAWDGENRLTSTSIGGVTGTYTYNGAGVRMSRAIGASSVSYVWDLTGNLPNVLQDSDGNSYVYGLDLISRTDSGGSQEYYLTDGLGSTTSITDGTGSVTGTYAYDAFGVVRAQTGATTEWSYTGEQNDPSALEFLRMRYYDTANGRFLSLDPLPLVQRYAYASGNPTNLIDPSGLFGTPAGLAKAAAAGGLELIKYTSQVILNSACWLATGGRNCKALLAWQAEVLKLGRKIKDGLSESFKDVYQFAGRFATLNCLGAGLGFGAIALTIWNPALAASPYVFLAATGPTWAFGVANNFSSITSKDGASSGNLLSAIGIGVDAYAYHASAASFGQHALPTLKGASTFGMYAATAVSTAQCINDVRRG